MRPLAITLLSCALAAGCGGRPVEADNGPPVDGIYDYSEETSGSCTPAPIASDLRRTIILQRSPDHQWVGMSGRPHYHPGPAPAWEETYLVDGRQVMPDSDFYGATMSWTLEREHQTGDSMAVRRVLRWKNLGNVAADNPAPYMIPNGDGDCETVTEMRYELAVPCSADCIKRDPTTFEPICTC
jgi:hypothetical protein